MGEKRQLLSYCRLCYAYLYLLALVLAYCTVFAPACPVDWHPICPAFCGMTCMNALMQVGLGPLDYDGRHWVHCWPHWVPAVYPHWHLWRHKVQHRQVPSTEKFVGRVTSISACKNKLHVLTANCCCSGHNRMACTLFLHLNFEDNYTPGTKASSCAPIVCGCLLARCKVCNVCAIQVADSSRKLIHSLAVQCDI